MISDLFAHLHPPPVHPPRHHRPPPRDREHVLDRHQKRLVHLPRRQRHILVERVHQLQNARHALRIPVQRPERAHPHHRHRIPRKPIRRQQLPHLELHQVQQLRVVHRIHLVQRHHQARHVHLPRQQHVLPRLRHRPVHRAHHQDAAVHLRRARDHVLDVVRMPRTVHVRVVPVRRAVLHVARRDRQDLRRIPPPLRLRRLRHLVIRDELRPALFRRHLRQRRRQRRLPVVDVPNRPHVHMRLRPIELFLRHDVVRSLVKKCVRPIPRSRLRVTVTEPLRCRPSLVCLTSVLAPLYPAAVGCPAKLVTRAKAGADDRD